MSMQTFHETKLNKAHKWFCRVEWCLWIIGIVLMLASKGLVIMDLFGYMDAWGGFIDFACILGSLLIFISLLPVQPVLFVLSMITSSEQKAPARAYISDIVRLALNFLIWYGLLAAWIGLTGGV